MVLRVLAAADPDHDGGVRRSWGVDEGLRGRAVHLHAVLISSQLGPQTASKGRAYGNVVLLAP